MPAKRTAASKTEASESLSPELTHGPADVPERSRNAKAQARHREKRKAYVDHLEKTVAALKSQLANMGVSPVLLPSTAASSSGGGTVDPANEARLMALVHENERLKHEIVGLRAHIDAMSSTGSSSSMKMTPPMLSLPVHAPLAEGSRRSPPQDYSGLHRNSIPSPFSSSSGYSHSPYTPSLDSWSRPRDLAMPPLSGFRGEFPPPAPPAQSYFARPNEPQQQQHQHPLVSRATTTTATSSPRSRPGSPGPVKQESSFDFGGGGGSAGGGSHQMDSAADGGWSTSSVRDAGVM